MRKDHQEQIVRWANFVKNNPHKWKKEHTFFINALFQRSNQFYQRLLNSPNGNEKFRLLKIKQKSL